MPDRRAVVAHVVRPEVPPRLPGREEPRRLLDRVGNLVRTPIESPDCARGPLFDSVRSREIENAVGLVINPTPAGPSEIADKGGRGKSYFSLE